MKGIKVRRCPRAYSIHELQPRRGRCGPAHRGSCSKNLKSSANFGIVRKPAESANFRRIPQVYTHFPLISIEQIVQTDLVLYVFCIGVIQQTISGHHHNVDTFLCFCNLSEDIFSVIQVLLVRL